MYCGSWNIWNESRSIILKLLNNLWMQIFADCCPLLFLRLHFFKLFFLYRVTHLLWISCNLFPHPFLLNTTYFSSLLLPLWQLFLDLLLPLNSRWVSVFDDIVKCSTFNTSCVFYGLCWIEYWFLRFANDGNFVFIRVLLAIPTFLDLRFHNIGLSVDRWSPNSLEMVLLQSLALWLSITFFSEVLRDLCCSNICCEDQTLATFTLQVLMLNCNYFAEIRLFGFLTTTYESCLGLIDCERSLW